MVEQDLVSIIIPSYNYAQHLKECIDSIIKQSYSRWEAIIVDDGSTDNTQEVAQELVKLNSEQIHYFRIENGGVTKARNFGIEKSQGEYLLPLDADDILLPHALEMFVAALKKSPEYGYAYSALENYQALPGREREWYPGAFYKNWIVRENNAACTSLWHRKFWEGGLKYRELIFEDWDLWLQIVAQNYQGIYIPHVLFKYRQHPYGRHSRNQMMGYLAFMEVAKHNPSLYGPQLVTVADAILAKAPDNITSKPTIVFALEPGSKEFVELSDALREVGRAFVEGGYFTTIMGHYSDHSLLQLGLAPVLMEKSASIEDFAGKLRSLGPELIVFSALDSQLTPRLMMEANVYYVVDISEKDSSLVHANLQIVSDKLYFKAKANFSSSGGEALSKESLVDVIIRNFEKERTAQDEATELFGKKQRELLSVETKTACPSVSNVDNSLSIVIPVHNPDLKQLKSCLQALSSIEDAGIDNIILSDCSSGAEAQEAIKSLCDDFSVEVFSSPTNNFWSKAHAANMGLNKSSAAWTMFLDPDIILGSDFLCHWHSYIDRIKADTLYLCEAARIPSVTQTKDIKEDMQWTEAAIARIRKKAFLPHSIRAGAIIAPTKWLKELRGLVNYYMEEALLEQELSFRAQLSSLKVCWLPTGSILRQWHICRAATEWQRWNSERFALYKQRPLKVVNSEQWHETSSSYTKTEDFPDLSEYEECFKAATWIEEQLGVRKSRAEHINLLVEWSEHALQHSQSVSAQWALEDALAYTQKDVNVFINLTRVYAMEGSVPAASHYLSLAQELEPDHEIVQKLSEMINDFVVNLHT